MITHINAQAERLATRIFDREPEQLTPEQFQIAKVLAGELYASAPKDGDGIFRKRAAQLQRQLVECRARQRRLVGIARDALYTVGDLLSENPEDLDDVKSFADACKEVDVQTSIWPALHQRIRREARS